MAPNPLPAPQATLISALAQGVIGGNLEWKMIGIGALVGVGLILLDAALGAMKKLRIPPLAVGIGIYLPMSATFAVVVGRGALALVRRRARPIAEPGARRAARHAGGVGADRRREHLGRDQRRSDRRVLEGRADRARAGDFAPAPWLGVLGFVGAIVWLYGWMLRRRRPCDRTRPGRSQATLAATSVSSLKTAVQHLEGG